MNPTEHPSLNNAVPGIVFQKQDPAQSIDVDYQALEIASVDLISKLENLLTKSIEKEKDDFIDESADTARKMLALLTEFINEFLTGNAAAQAKEETDRALTFAHTFEEVLKTRSFINTVVRVFWNLKESEDILKSQAELGEALVRACATTFYHAIMLMGTDTEFGKEIDQSSVVFINQLQKSWS